jgi:hypothetical protein
LVTANGNALPDVPVTANAFGALEISPEFLGNARLVVQVVRTRAGNPTVLLTRKVNKGPGPLALDLRVDSEGSFAPGGGLPKGISLLGFPVDPFLSLNSEVIGVPDNQLLSARYNSSKAKYDLYPDLEPYKIGHAYFVRSDAAKPAFTVSGRIYTNVEGSVALKPGWNLIASPIQEITPTSRIRVVKASDSPVDWAEAAGTDIGTEFFEFIPGPIDPATGAPETGSMTPATQFEPGKGYFVRVLAPEGVTLVFRQSSLTGTSLNRAYVVSPSQNGWRMNLTLTSPAKRSISAVIGQSSTATRAFDPREDSGMPPGIGGLQIILEDYEAMYRDIRPVGGGEVYTLHLQGLTPNKLHKLDFRTQFGNVPTLTIRDSKGKTLGMIRSGMTFSLFPKSKDEYLQIVVGGNK